MSGASGASGAGANGSGLRSRLRLWLAGSAWAPLLGKAAAYVGGFAILALVGSGVLSGFLARIAGVSAAPASPPAAAAPETAAPLRLREEPAASGEATDAGAATDAGTDAGTGTGTGTHAGAGKDTGAGTDTGAAKHAPASGSGGGGGITPDGKVVINLASEEDLRRLPGVGPSKAKAILALRAKLGRFRRPEDLLRVKGIGRRRLARLRPLLVVDAQ